MKYKILLADADGTLLDFAAAEKASILKTFSHFSLPADDEHYAIYHKANRAQWLLFEQGKTTQDKLKVERFRDYLELVNLEGNPQALSECFVGNLSEQRQILDGSLSFVQRVSEHMPIHIVTNGIGAVQKSRFSNCEISPYLSGLYISEEIGKPKPDPTMLFQALSDARIENKQDALLIGDSINADIGAANAAGIDSLLLWMSKSPLPENHGATYVATSFEEAIQIVLQ